MVWATYMSPWSSIVGLYFNGDCVVISVTMAMHRVQQKGPLNVSFGKFSEKLIRWPTVFISLFESSLKIWFFNFSDSIKKSYLVEFNIF